MTASLITDDNRLPALTTSLKLRMVNGLTGAATPLTLNAAFAVVASNVAPGAASPYARPRRGHAGAARRLHAVEPDADLQHRQQSGTGAPLLLPGNSVFTLFMLGMLRRFRTDRASCERTAEARRGQAACRAIFGDRRSARVNLGKHRQAPGDRHLN